MATMKGVKFLSSDICRHTTDRVAQTANVIDTDHTQHGNVNKLFLEMKK
jgi:hypothetical protein